MSGHTRHDLRLVVPDALPCPVASAPSVLHQREIQQPVGVVVGGAEQLAAWEVFEDGRYAAVDPHRGGFQRCRMAKRGRGGAIGAQQEGGLDQVALRLLDRSAASSRSYSEPSAITRSMARPS